MEDKTPFHNWFDVYDQTHLKALQAYMTEGHWPKHFMPADVEFDDRSMDETYKKLAFAWIRQKTSTGIRSEVFGKSATPMPEGDTSLGAELLDEIYPATEGRASVPNNVCGQH